MALIDRLKAPENNNNGEEVIPIHLFSACINLLELGVLTRSQVVSGLNMSANDEIQLDKLTVHYLALDNDGKREFFGKLESIGILLEQGLITKAQFVSLLGLE